jgi:hypothetical protein
MALDHVAQTGTTSAAFLQWRKSKACNAMTNCVELAALPDGSVAIRNSSDPTSPVLVSAQSEFAAVLISMKIGEFDYLAA